MADAKKLPSGKDPNEHRMSLGEHLQELRSRMFKAILACIAGALCVWHWREQMFAWLLRPFEVAWFCKYRADLGNECSIPEYLRYMSHPVLFSASRELTAHRHPPTNPMFTAYAQLHFPDPVAAFMAYIKIAAIGGLVVALPAVFYQAWSFIGPGLYDREKRYILPFAFFSTAFFLLGAGFGYYFVFPVGHEFFLTFSGTVAGTRVVVLPTIMMDEYLGFTTQMLLAFGIVFELPLFVFFLSLAGVVTWRQLLSFGRYFTVLAFILAAILTPTPDVFSQTMLGAPLVILYFVAVGLAYIFGAKTAKPSKFTRKEDDKNPPEPPGAGGGDTTDEVAAKVRAAKERRAREMAVTGAAKAKKDALLKASGKGPEKP